MPQGQAVSEAIQWTVIRLSATMPSHEISGYTDISDRKIRDIIAHFNKTGDIKGSKRERPTLHRSLQDEDIRVYFNFELLRYANYTIKHLFNTLSSTPDLYLDELRLELQEKFGVSVALSTIWRTLKKSGYSMKKVSRQSSGR